MSIPLEGYAFLDALAVGESGGDYTILYGGGHFSDFSKFPVWGGLDDSHAAGRYQFEPATWAGEAAKLHLKDFSPANQDIAAWDLAVHVYAHCARRNLEDDLCAGVLGHVAGALHSTWTSLNYLFLSRYDTALARRKAVLA